MSLRGKKISLFFSIKSNRWYQEKPIDANIIGVMHVNNNRLVNDYKCNKLNRLKHTISKK